MRLVSVKGSLHLSVGCSLIVSFQLKSPVSSQQQVSSRRCDIFSPLMIGCENMLKYALKWVLRCVPTLRRPNNKWLLNLASWLNRFSPPIWVTYPKGWLNHREPSLRSAYFPSRPQTVLAVLVCEIELHRLVNVICKSEKQGRRAASVCLSQWLH